ncbi:MAG TPA: neutral/alkaline non-lysosomal ceramidase N-terminal domain-containing protein [Actinomycetota bacterium]|nr:neutral/alkaline non-lysosomal ceramidase N-terminal domain-containing protein [Actinomycetota bacterium]
MSRRRGLPDNMRTLLVIISLLAATFSSASGLRRQVSPATFEAGVGVADITPDLGRNFDGYVRPDILAHGIATRLWARTLLLERGTKKIALVSVDLVGALGDLQRALATRLGDLGLNDEMILLLGSHTHSGPDMMINTTSTPTIKGGDPTADVKAFLVDRISLSVRRAHATLQPAKVGWGSAIIRNANDNRSLEAHLANFGIDAAPHTKTPADDPKGRLDAIDPILDLLRVDVVRGGRAVPLAAWFRFSAHDTAFPPANDLYSSDWSGIAQWRFEEDMARGGHPGVTALFANGDVGDMVSRNDSYDPYATADSEAKKIARGMETAWARAGRHMTSSPVLDERRAIVCFCGQTFTDADGRKRQVASQGFMGASFLGGAQNGPSIFYQPLQTEGKRRPAALADPVWGRKILAFPVPYATVMPIEQVRIADGIIATIPGEPSIEVGRRIQAAMARKGATRSSGINFAVVVGLAQEYTGYYTTPDEYDKQFYEGGHTVYGKWSSDLLIQAHGDLTDRLMHRKPDPAPEGTLSAPRIDGPPTLTGDGGAPGAITGQPAQRVARMNVVTVAWNGGADGKDRPLDRAFITLERLSSGSKWRAATSDLDPGFEWRSQGSAYSASFDVAPEFSLGTYRFTIASARYTLRSRPFEVVPSEALSVLGVTARRSGSSTILSFIAANPAPDPILNFWDRSRSPSGGAIAFVFHGHAGRAAFQGGKWVARVTGDARSGVVAIPPHGVLDRWGNMSGPGTTLTIGRVRRQQWPPVMPVGGFCVPGPFGQGCFWPQAVYPWPPGNYPPGNASNGA